MKSIKINYFSSLTLLVLQLLLLLMKPLIMVIGNSVLVLGILTALLFIDIFIEDWSRKNKIIKFSFLTINIVCTLLYLNNNIKFYNIIYVVSILILFFYSLIIKFTRIISAKIIDKTIIFSSINFYLLAGYTGACLAWLVEIIWPNSFLINNHNSTHQLFDFVYFSFVTMATLGYGDIIPSSEEGKTIALFISLFGQLYVTIFLAIIVSKYLKQE